MSITVSLSLLLAFTHPLSIFQMKRYSKDDCGHWWKELVQKWKNVDQTLTFRSLFPGICKSHLQCVMWKPIIMTSEICQLKARKIILHRKVSNPAQWGVNPGPTPLNHHHFLCSNLSWLLFILRPSAFIFGLAEVVAKTRTVSICACASDHSKTHYFFVIHSEHLPVWCPGGFFLAAHHLYGIVCIYDILYEK